MSDPNYPEGVTARDIDGEVNPLIAEETETENEEQPAWWPPDVQNMASGERREWGKPKEIEK